ncbi:Aminoacyl-histidine_dipeptidase [Hexamita inflata]|uniref:Aminoacyl-histidine dipeptidase n=1 Tax=Hexamita inflata TaxID=28002 RepID=A0AA86RAC7_9EUKA|nr:Aminoacyl-histidine dipeptidase [Hexamita inflata]
MSLTENNKKVLEQLPKGYHAVFAEFVKMCEIPHGSGNRAGITSHLKKWAEEHKFEVVVDEIDNVLIRVPATPGCESTPGICLQGHTVVSEPTLILTNVYVIIALENQITVFMLIITYSINSAVHFFFTSSFK